MRRKEVVMWALIIGFLAVMNFRSTPKSVDDRGSMQAVALPPPPADGVKVPVDTQSENAATDAVETDAPMPRRKVTAAPDETAEPRHEVHDITAAPTPAPQLAAEAGDASNAGSLLMERMPPSWSANTAFDSHCSAISSLFDAVMDTGGDARQRLVMGFVSAFVTREMRVADVASATLHNLVAMLRWAPAHAFSLAVTNEAFVTARHVLDEYHRECHGSGDISDASVKLEVREGWDVMVVGSALHAKSLVDHVKGGHIDVRRYFIVAQSVMTGDVSRLLTEMSLSFVGAGWTAIMAMPEVGVAVWANPRGSRRDAQHVAKHPLHDDEAGDDVRAPEQNDYLDKPQSTDPRMVASNELSERDREIPAEIRDNGHRTAYRQIQRRLARARDRGDEVVVQRMQRQLDDMLSRYRLVGGHHATAGARDVLQLVDEARIATRKRPLPVCLEFFSSCKICKTELLCADKEDITTTEQELDAMERLLPPVAANLVTMVALNPKIPISVFVPFLTLAALGTPSASTIAVFGCYPALAAPALGGARGNYSRVLLVSSAPGCDVTASRRKGGLRQRVPDAVKMRLTTATAQHSSFDEVSLVFTTTRFANAYSSLFAELPQRVVILVLGQSSKEPLKVQVGSEEMTRLEGSVGLSVYYRAGGIAKSTTFRPTQ